MAGLGAVQIRPQEFGPTERVRTFLLSLLRPSSSQRYQESFAYLLDYALEHGVTFGSLSEEEQDYFLADCVLDSVDNGVSLHSLRYMVAAAQKFYAHRRRYAASLRVLEGLSSQRPPVQAEPFPEPLLYALVVLLVACGKAGVATALLLAFCGLLRISEALQLMADDVLLPEVHRGGRFILLLLRSTKRGVPHTDKVIIGNPSVVEFVRRFWSVRGTEPGRFTGATYTSVRYWLRRSLAGLGLDPDSFRSHSCRRGGATALSLAGMPFADIQVAGRWASAQSCRLYIQKAEVALARFKHRIPDAQWQLFLRLSRIGVRAFDLRDVTA